MDVAVCVFLIVIGMYAEIILYRIKVYKTRLSDIKIENKVFMERIYREETTTSDVTFETGSFYGYNAINKTIRYELKETYTCYDLFGLNHEIGHLRDDKSNQIRFFTVMKAMERLLFLPLYIVLCILKLVNSSWHMWWTQIFLAILLMLAFLQIFFIHKYENSASKYALTEVERYDEMHVCETFAKLCIKQQMLLEILEIAVVIFLNVIKK